MKTIKPIPVLRSPLFAKRRSQPTLEEMAVVFGGGRTIDQIKEDQKRKEKHV